MLLAVVLLYACHSQTAPSKPDLLASNIDSTVPPSKDFFLYANGAWIKRTPIPASESAWGIGNLVDEDIYARLRKINEESVAKTSPAGSTEQKIGDFWFSGMDTAEIEKQKLQPLQPQLQKIAAIRTPADMLATLISLHNAGMDAAFADYVGQDDKRSDLMAVFLRQGGLGMPNRDYYFNTDSSSLRVRAAYRRYLYLSFFLITPDSLSAAKSAAAVFELETRLAHASRSRVALRDPYRNYNKMSLAGLQKHCSAIDWTTYFRETGMGKPDSVIVGQPEYLTALDKEWLQSSPAIWKVYFQFHLLNDYAGALDSVTRDNAFQYYKTLSGASEQRPRWKRVLDNEERIMGELLGELFVKANFTAQDKQRVTAMVENVRSALRERIRALAWMSDSTKNKAYRKLAKINVKAGYPDKWKDLGSLVIDRGPWAMNIQRGRIWWRAYQVRKLGRPVDKTEWGMTPQTYNAYYDPSNNEAVFPAAMFIIPGYKTDELDDGFMYGYAAASTIGHELTHGFDDQGRQYDADGNLKGWWLPADSVAFTARAVKIIRQFNLFNPVDTLHINGAATEGENIADLGGLLIGLDALKKTSAWQRNEKIGGFTPLQRFFLGYAYSWMLQEKPASLATQVMTDEHSPAKERVNGPVINIPEFYEAFEIKPGSPMYQPDSLRVSIW